MRIQNIKVEFVDRNSRFVLKRITTDEGEEFHNRKLAVCNVIYSCERKRMVYGKPLFNSLFQTFHIGWDKNEEEWDYKGLVKAKKHAEQNKRIFVPYKQRNENQWAKLTWEEAEDEFNMFKDKTDVVPYPIPLNASLKEWEIKKKRALESLKPTQELIAIISTKHLNVEEFPLIVRYELKNSKFFGVCCYSISDVLERRNLFYLNSINSSFNVGENTALVFCFDYPRILKNHSYIAGCFAFCCFAGDVFSEKAHFPFQWNDKGFEKIMQRKPKEYLLYDIKEKKFTKSIPQKKWYGFDLTQNFLGQISVAEGLDGYYAVRWINHHLQQKDLDLINEVLISKRNILSYLNNYTGWSVFWNSIKPNSQIIQKTLDFK